MMLAFALGALVFALGACVGAGLSLAGRNDNRMINPKDPT